MAIGPQKPPPCDLCGQREYDLVIYGACLGCISGLISAERDRLHEQEVMRNRRPPQ